MLSWHCGIDVKNNLSIQKAEVGELGDSSPMGDSGKNKSVSPPGPCAAALLIVRGLESRLKQKNDISGRDTVRSWPIYLLQQLRIFLFL